MVFVFDEINTEQPNRWGATTTRTPFLKVVGGRYVGRRPMWGNRLPYRSTLIRPQNSVSPEWLVVELSQKFMDKADPFGSIGNASKEYGTNMCDLLTVLGDYDHGLEEIGVKSMERSLKKFRLT